MAGTAAFMPGIAGSTVIVACLALAMMTCLAGTTAVVVCLTAAIMIARLTGTVAMMTRAFSGATAMAAPNRAGWLRLGVCFVLLVPNIARRCVVMLQILLAGVLQQRPDLRHGKPLHILGGYLRVHRLKL